MRSWALLLTGCGGHDDGGVGCAAVYRIEAAAATRTYDLTVVADGSVSGSGRDGDATHDRRGPLVGTYSANLCRADSTGATGKPRVTKATAD